MNPVLKGFVLGVVLILVAALAYNLISGIQSRNTVEDFSRFIQRVDEGEVKEVTFAGANEITYVTNRSGTFRAILPPPVAPYEGLTKSLIERGIRVKATAR